MSEERDLIIEFRDFCMKTKPFADFTKALARIERKKADLEVRRKADQVIEADYYEERRLIAKEDTKYRRELEHRIPLLWNRFIVSKILESLEEAEEAELGKADLKGVVRVERAEEGPDRGGAEGSPDKG